jgi:mannitol-1-phosphate 5-dehydrogenase
MNNNEKETLKQPIVIIGAGKTGRGFIARLVSLSKQPIVFIERDEVLIERLNSQAKYQISFFGGQRNTLEIAGFNTYLSASTSALNAMASAALIIVSVGVSNFDKIAPDLAKAIQKRLSEKKSMRLPIITAENAVDPAKKLTAAISSFKGSTNIKVFSEAFIVAESAIFCTTIEKEKNSLDIKSEDFDILPFDAKNIQKFLPKIYGFMGETEFNKVLKRKIYTYNCASACISYLGHIKGYTSYYQAASDDLIEMYLKQLYLEVGEVLCKEYGYTKADQDAFAARSLYKFQDPEIEDSIERNARDVIRKLQPDERLAGPELLMEKYAIISKALPIVYAAALCYHHSGEDELENLINSIGVEGIIKNISHIDPASLFAGKVIMAYRNINNSLKIGNSSLNDVLKRGLE